MRKFRTLAIVALLVLSSLSLFASEKAKTIEAYVKAFNDLGRFNGSVLVADEGKIVLSRGYGKANFEWDIPNTPDTKFRLGSITKQFTSMVVMQLVSEGKIKLDDPITTYLPDYRKDTGSKVTVRHLLNHTSGIPSYTSNPALMSAGGRDPVTVDEFIKVGASGDLEFEPGSKFSYNNSGYYLLGAIIEKVTGKKYEDALKERIFVPLGMNDTGYDHFETVISKRATGYEKRGDLMRNARYLDMSIPYAAGALYSTVQDLYKWDQALYSDKLLKPELRAMMFSPGLERYGFGWFIGPMKLSDSKSIDTIAHSGGIFGFNTVLTRVPSKRQLVVLLDNTSQGASLDRISRGVFSILEGLPYDMPKPPFAQELQKTFDTKGSEAAAAIFRKYKSEKEPGFEFNEGEINALGYRQMQAGKLDDAIAVFEMNTQMLPKSWNVWDSLAEAHAAKGNKKKAIELYKKSVELNPENQNGKDAIKRLEAPEVKVDPATFVQLTGVYTLAPGFELTITTADGKLYGQATGQPRVTLVADSENEFHLAEVPARIVFQRDASGGATSLVLHQGGREMPAKKK